jgi:hypothetical protein
LSNGWGLAGASPDGAGPWRNETIAILGYEKPCWGPDGGFLRLVGFPAHFRTQGLCSRLIFRTGRTARSPIAGRNFQSVYSLTFLVAGLHSARFVFANKPISSHEFIASGPWGHMAEELKAVESGAQRARSRMRHV